MTKRERTIAIVTGAAVGIFALDRYVLTPYQVERSAVAAEKREVLDDMGDTERLFVREKLKKRRFREMLAGGLKSDPAETEEQLLNAVQSWAQEAGVNLTNTKPERVNRNDRVQVVKLRAIGTGTTAAVSRLLWKLETANIPLKVEDLQLGSRRDGVDDLSVTLTVSTIWVTPEPQQQRTAAPARPAASRTGQGDESI